MTEPHYNTVYILTHWGRVTHICVGKLSIIGSDNGLSHSRRQAIIWTNAGILLIGTMGKNFSEIAIQIYTFSFKKMHLKMSSGKWRPFCFGLNLLKWDRNRSSYWGNLTARMTGHGKSLAYAHCRISRWPYIALVWIIRHSLNFLADIWLVISKDLG